jgi:hypothetical protein
MEVVKCVIMYGGLTIETALSIFYSSKETYKLFDNVLLRLNIGYAVVGSLPDIPCYEPGRVWMDQYFLFPISNCETWSSVVSAMRNVGRLRSELWTSFTTFTDTDCRPEFRREIHAHEFYTLLIAHGHFGLANQLAEITKPRKDHRGYAMVLHGGWDEFREELGSDEEAAEVWAKAYHRNGKTIVPVSSVSQFDKLDFWMHGVFNADYDGVTDELLNFFYDILKRRSQLVLDWFLLQWTTKLHCIPRRTLQKLPAVKFTLRLCREAQNWGNPQAIEGTETMLRAFKY